MPRLPFLGYSEQELQAEYERGFVAGRQEAQEVLYTVLLGLMPASVREFDRRHLPDFPERLSCERSAGDDHRRSAIGVSATGGPLIEASRVFLYAPRAVSLHVAVCFNMPDSGIPHAQISTGVPW